MAGTTPTACTAGSTSSGTTSAPGARMTSSPTAVISATDRPAMSDRALERTVSICSKNGMTNCRASGGSLAAVYGMVKDTGRFGWADASIAHAVPSAENAAAPTLPCGLWNSTMMSMRSPTARRIFSNGSSAAFICAALI